MKTILSRIILFSLMVGSAFAVPVVPITHAAPNVGLGPSDFLKTSGTVIRNNSGTGAIVNLRGTNLGGWLLQEGWMSPAGEAALDRAGWTASASNTQGGSSPA